MVEKNFWSERHLTAAVHLPQQHIDSRTSVRVVAPPVCCEFLMGEKDWN
jgi:hypothetical protein